MDDATKTMIGAIIRTVIIAIGGGVYFSQDQLTGIAGAAAVLIGAAWSLWQKRAAENKQKVVVATAVGMIQSGHSAQTVLNLSKDGKLYP